MEAEQMLVPDFFNSEKGEPVLRKEFAQAQNTTFCDVDVDAVLKDLEWIDFLGEWENLSPKNRTFHLVDLLLLTITETCYGYLLGIRSPAWS